MKNASRPTRDRKLARHFGARLQELRQNAGFSQLALSLESGCHVSFISALETGNRQPSLMTLRKLASGLGVRIEDLVAGLSDDRDRNGAAVARIVQLVRAMSREKAALARDLIATLAKK